MCHGLPYLRKIAAKTRREEAHVNGNEACEDQPKGDPCPLRLPPGFRARRRNAEQMEALQVMDHLSDIARSIDGHGRKASR
mmetsp:Transcript_64070/g.179273  ORF Transcript_64070/g.179273 Transcript_64070/m.179273 type:complete len:81 (-) Transcript_64070:29-271(-)